MCVVVALVFGTRQSLLSFSDLACRNCLIGSDGCVKIGDYGISPQKYKVRGSSLLSKPQPENHSSVDLSKFGLRRGMVRTTFDDHVGDKTVA